MNPPMNVSVCSNSCSSYLPEWEEVSTTTRMVDTLSIIQCHVQTLLHDNDDDRYNHVTQQSKHTIMRMKVHTHPKDIET